MRPIDALLRNPVKVAVGVLLLSLFGVIALMRMPMQLTPEVEEPTLTIETRWPGASPQEVEREIVQEQEEELKGVEGVTKMSAECMDSTGRITLEFRIGTSMDEALLKVNSRLQQVREYPTDAEQPVISTTNSSNRPIAWFILGARPPSAGQLEELAREEPELAPALRALIDVQNPGRQLRILRELAEEHPSVRRLLPHVGDVTKMRRFAENVIEARFERIAGVSDSNVIGGLEDELQVSVDPQLLAARQLTIADLRFALREENADTSGGDFWEGKRRYVVRTLGKFTSPAEVAEQVIAIRDGVPVYVRDVAEVRLGYKKPGGIVRRYGTSNIAVNVLRETGANVITVMEGLRAANRELNENYLSERGLQLHQVYDETDYILSAVRLVNQNIVVGGFLTVVVLLLFLRSGRSTLVIGLAIPISLVGTFLLLHLMGRSLNVVSLAGLAFAVGMLVDNAVVVLENIYRHHQQGKPPFVAAADATMEVAGAVLASTLTTMAVFLPVLFVQQEAGQLFRDISLAISFAVGLSLIVSLTVIPTAASRLFRRQAANDPAAQPSVPDQGWSPLAWLDRLAARLVGAVVALNGWLLEGVLRRLAMIVVLLGAAGSVTYFLWPKVEYLPTGNRNLVFGILLPPPGYNLNELMALGEHVEKLLRPYWDVEPGSPEAQALDAPAIADFFFVARGRQVFLGLRSAEPARAAQLVPLIQKVAAGLPGTFAVAKQSSLFEQGLSAGRTIDIEITGPELTHLVGLGRQILGQVNQLMPTAQARPVPSLDLSSPEVHVVPYRVKARDLGITAADLGYTVDALVDGAYAADYYLDGEKIDLTIVGRDDFAERTHQLPGLDVATPTGQLVPLSSLARINLSSGPEQVNRRERQRAVTIEVSPPIDLALEQAIQMINTEIISPLRQQGGLAGGYMISLSGTADKLRDTWLALRWNVLLALLITYLLMAALFESWVYPLVIIVSVPLGAVGGVAGLKLLGWYLGWMGQPPQALDVITMLGFVILIGTVVNNAILIVHQSLNFMRDADLTPRQAVMASVRVRVRPIFMTTLTTVLGLAPLVFFPGSGSELYRGLGSVVLGGLVVSTVFTLVLVPTLFSLLMEARHEWSDWRQNGRTDVEIPSQPVDLAQPLEIPVQLGAGSDHESAPA